MQNNSIKGIPYKRNAKFPEKINTFVAANNKVIVAGRS